MKTLVSDSLNEFDRVSLAFEKLLFDRCEFELPPDSIQEQRWDLISLSERIREENIFESHTAYREAVAEYYNQDLSTLEKSFYEDLPEFKKISKFKNLTAEDLIHRYNCAQVQGLLLFSREITLSFEKASNSEKRAIFRRLKFHQLLVKIRSQTPLEIELSGPLSLFDQSQKYGIKLANFFPYLLHLSQFTLQTNVKIKNDFYDFKVGEKCGIKSHYQYSGSYIPEDFKLAVDDLNKKDSSFSAEFCGEYLNIGRQSYCLPDFKISFQDGRRPVYVELFHKWHCYQLKNRLQTLSKYKSKEQVLLGVCKSIGKDTEIEKSSAFQELGFFFRDFPTAKQIIKAVEKSFPASS